MSQKLPVNCFEWVKDLSQFKEDFIKNYDENNDKGYFLEVGAQYPRNLFNLHGDSRLFSERKKIGKCKQALNHGLILKKVQRVIQFNQKAWLKAHIDMNAELRNEAKNNFEKDFFKLMNNAVFGKTMKNVRKDRHIKLVTTGKRRNPLA